MEGMDSYMPDFPEERDMSVKLSKVLSVGMKFSYEYDFGSTTTLKLKVVAEREGEPRRGKKTVQILARNVPPVIPCDLCGKPATLIAGEGYYEEGGVNAVCHECSEKPPEDEDEYYGGYEEMLPVVNSPRIGVCGYTGD